MDYPKSELWNYSTHLWTLPGVEDLCISLQTEYDADVNLLIYCLWLGEQKRCLNEDDLQVMLDTVKPWQTMIKPLRNSRRMMQQQMIAMPGELVEQSIANMKEMEINAEHMAQLALEKALDPDNIQRTESASIADCGLANLQLYMLSRDSIDNINDVTAILGQLLTAVVADEEAVQMALMNQLAG